LIGRATGLMTTVHSYTAMQRHHGLICPGSLILSGRDN
jgi:hypothetical protein